MVAIAEESGYDFSLLKGVIDVNEQQRSRIVDKVRAALDGSVAGKTVGMWGLAFKAGTDDVRESPAVDLAVRLASEGAVVRAYDPKVVASFESVERVPDPVAAAKDADLLLIATEWSEFRSVDLRDVRDAMRGKAIVDARNMLDRKAVERLGMSYAGVGR